MNFFYNDTTQKEIELIVRNVEKYLPPNHLFYAIAGLSVFKYFHRPDINFDKNNIDVIVFVQNNSVQDQSYTINNINFNIISQSANSSGIHANNLIISESPNADTLPCTLSSWGEDHDHCSLESSGFDLIQGLMIKNYLSARYQKCLQIAINPYTKKFFGTNALTSSFDRSVTTEYISQLDFCNKKFISQLATSSQIAKLFNLKFNIFLYLDLFQYQTDIPEQEISSSEALYLKSIPRIDKYLHINHSNPYYIVTSTKYNINPTIESWFNEKHNKITIFTKNNKDTSFMKSLLKNTTFVSLEKILQYRKSQQDILILFIKNNIINDSELDKIGRWPITNFNYNKFLQLHLFFKKHSFFSGFIDFNQIEKCFKFFKQLSKESEIFIGFVETLWFLNTHKTPNYIINLETLSQTSYVKIQDLYDFHFIKSAFDKYLESIKQPLTQKITIPQEYTPYIQELTSIEELQQEGFDMNHCVGGYGFKIKEQKSRVFKISLNNQNATLETDFFVTTVQQIKAKFNKNTSEEIINLVNLFITKINDN